MPTHTIIVDQDSLEYTPRDGLRTREPIPLTVGAHNRVVIRRPPRKQSASAYAAFRHDSAFPHGSALAVLLGLSFGAFFAGRREGSSERKAQIYGHAEPSGDEDHNKALSERRAKAFAALLTCSPAELEAVADADGWGLEEHQFMLRVLRCDPGPIDGQEGDLTTQAVHWFQREYRDGVFHRVGQTPSNPQLELSGKLDEHTVKALLEAYCEALSPASGEMKLVSTNPTVGCSEYNLSAGDVVDAHRRVSLVVYDDPQPFAGNAPCTEGDHQKCSLDERGPRRCLWYRDHVLEPDPSSVDHLHFDLRWLPLPNGRVLLTALTTLPEGSNVTFEVFQTHPIGTSSEIEDTVLDRRLSDELSGEVVLGVAQVVWTPPPGFDIHDLASWQARNPKTTTIDAWNSPAGATVPVFRVSGGGHSTLSPPPGADLDRVVCMQERTDDGVLPTGLLAWDAFGNQYFVPLENGRPPKELHALADEIPRVVVVGYSDTNISPSLKRRSLL